MLTLEITHKWERVGQPWHCSAASPASSVHVPMRELTQLEYSFRDAYFRELSARRLAAAARTARLPRPIHRHRAAFPLRRYVAGWVGLLPKAGRCAARLVIRMASGVRQFDGFETLLHSILGSQPVQCLMQC